MAGIFVCHLFFPSDQRLQRKVEILNNHKWAYSLQLISLEKKSDDKNYVSNYEVRLRLDFKSKIAIINHLE